MKIHEVVKKLHKAKNRGIYIKLPMYVEPCPICKGLGEYDQTYTAGCGMGTYRSLGACDYCKLEKVYYSGSGYRYKEGRGSVPASVMYQIYEMNKAAIEIADQLIKS